MTPQFNQPVRERACSKIVATVGPACSSVDMLGQLIAAGADVFRLNMAHGNETNHDELLGNIRAAAQLQERAIGVLIDLAGPKIRLGPLHVDPLQCVMGAEFVFVRGAGPSAANELTTNYEPLVDELSEGDRILLADGTVGLRVTKKTADRAHCVVTMPGILRSRQGVNLPGVKLSIDAITPQDRRDAVWAAKRNVDFVSLSFVRDPEEIRHLKQMLRELGSHALTISKIEKPEALARLDEIILASDGVMVARGDLGVEIDIEATPIEQKRIISLCTRYRRPVIVATQMLDSMQESRRPTRAEASDVANAILDGADACMLSGETAIGKYPRESVETMNRIMLATETLMRDSNYQHTAPDPKEAGVHRVTEAVVFGAAKIAHRLAAKVFAIQTKTGRTALAKAKQRDMIPTIAVSSSEETLRKMCLFWGIEPVGGAPSDGALLGDFVGDWGKQRGVLSPGDLIVLMASGDFRKAAHNRVVVHEVS